MKHSTGVLLLMSVFLCSAAAQESGTPLPKGALSGLMFGDYYYNIRQRDTAKENLNGFAFRRIYFTYDYAISPKFDSRFRLEADQSSNSLTAGGKLGVMVKDAYIKWKGIFEGHDLIFGLSPTPAFDVSEDAWGYRSLEKTIMDLRGIVSSRDMGIDMKGQISSDNMARYWVKIGNNASNGPEGDKFKRYYGLLQFKLTDEVQATLYGDFDAENGVVDPLTHDRVSNDRITEAFFLGYRKPNNCSIGLEAFHKTVNNGMAAAGGGLQNMQTWGITGYAWGSVADDVRLVGRVDYFDPNTQVDKDGSILVIAALDYLPSPDVHVMPNVEIQSYQADVESDVVARMTFYYVFH